MVDDNDTFEPHPDDAELSWASEFVQTFRRTRNPVHAARSVKRTYREVQDTRARSPYFRELYQDLTDEAAADLEGRALHQATFGTLEPVYQGGEKCGVKRVFDHRLAQFFLRAFYPERYAVEKGDAADMSAEDRAAALREALRDASARVPSGGGDEETD